MSFEKAEASIETRGKIRVSDVISALQRMDGSFATQEQKVADFVMSQMENISTMTIAELATASGVSKPTVVRFCRTLGCEGYREFKLRLAQNLAVSLQYLEAGTSRDDRHGDDAMDQVLSALSAASNYMRAQLDREALDRAQSAIARCRNLVVVGIGGGSSMLAEEAANRFFRLGLSAIALSDSYLMQMRSATLGREDVLLAISASGEADAIVAAARIASGYGATTICLTKTGTSLADTTDISINFDLPEDPDIFKPTASRYAFLVLLDTLAMSVAQANADTTRENLRRIRASLTAYHGRTGSQPLGD
ncbi:MurR/RpiR family transcriptional regulator [Nitratireductor sp. XY-223]|uniref:MurR/RpiR family transcriptional regulator n=1 Tax=Nitratireductor sp. XY-223 TaxID=2561926 RepID=UPI0010A9FB82|nr:MurR/RpiR family transcriptional regulator [Nitratireductor sp. XY-223]